MIAGSRLRPPTDRAEWAVVARTALRTVVRACFLVAAVILLSRVRSETGVVGLVVLLALAVASLYVALGSMPRTWLLYIVGFVLFAQLRAYADDIGMPVQHHYTVVTEKALFLGTIPSIWLQDHFYTYARLGPLEVLTIATYMSYFFLPHVLALALWKWDRERFGRYAVAFIVTLYAGVAVAVLLPTEPPWLASQLGDIPHVYQVLPDVSRNVTPGTYERAYELAGSNPVAAMPSLHAAIPFLMAYALWKYRPLRFVGLSYAVLMSFSVVYLGEHYAVDTLAGAATAGLAFAVAPALRRRASSLLKSIGDFGRGLSGGRVPLPVGYLMPRRRSPLDVAIDD